MPSTRSVDGFIPARPTDRRQLGNFRTPQTYRPTRQVGAFKKSEVSRPAQPNLAAHSGRRRPGVRAAEATVSEKHSKGIKTGFIARLKKGLSWRKFTWRRGLVGLTVVTLLAGGFIVGSSYLKARNIFKGGGTAVALEENVDPSRLKGEGDGRVNILLLGKGGPGHEAPDLTDTLVIASLDPIHKELALLSVPRDLYVSVEGFGQMKINGAYATAKQSSLSTGAGKDTAEEAGLHAIQKTIEETMGIPVHYRVMVDFEAFRRAIDTVGGVTINVEEPLYDATVAWENGGSALIADKGIQTFNGKKALLYARSRHGSARGDFDRADRQRQIIVALMQKAVSLGTLANPIKISELADAFGDHTRTNLGVGEVMRLYELTKDMPATSIQSLSLVNDPPEDFVTTANVGGLSVVIPKAGVGNYKDIQSYVRNKLKDGYLRSEDAKVMVLNGTNKAGLATAKADVLKSYAYNVVQVGDAPTKNYEQTVLVDLRGGEKKYTKRYLEQRFNTQAIGSLPDAAIQALDADFVIILGSNESVES